MKALLYLIDLNDRSSNESSITVNRLSARKLFKQWKINRLSNSRDREPSRIPGGECFFPDVWRSYVSFEHWSPRGVLPEKLGGVCGLLPKTLTLTQNL